MTTTPHDAATPVRRGDLVRLQIEEVANGGHCIAHHEGRVVFVRHTLPGEVVHARITSAAKESYLRADAVAVITASPDRVDSRCAVSGPGGCGGCDWQHADLGAQRRSKAAVVQQLMARLAGVDLPDLEVEAVPRAGDDGLGWRTRVRFAVDDDGHPGFRKHRSHDVVPVVDCPIAHPRVNEVGVGSRRWPTASAVEVVAPAHGPDRLVVVEPRGEADRVRVPNLDGAPSVAVRGEESLTRLSGRTWLEEEVVVAGAARRFRVSGTGFWQVHPGAAQTLLDAVMAAAAPAPGERAVDLYSGAGLFSAGLAAAVGPTGSVLAVESDRRAVADARRTLHDVPQVELVVGTVEEEGQRPEVSGDVVVLDPPRTGAGRDVMTRICGAGPRVVVYVSCDPATLARDIATAQQNGYVLAGVRAFDLFPMTHHVECVAVLRPQQ